MLINLKLRALSNFSVCDDIHFSLIAANGKIFTLALSYIFNIAVLLSKDDLNFKLKYILWFINKNS